MIPMIRRLQRLLAQHASLPLQMSLLLGGLVSLFWCLTTAVAFYTHYEELYREELALMRQSTTANNALINDTLNGIAADVQTLSRTWAQLEAHPGLQHRHFLAASYIPLTSAMPSPGQLNLAKSFIEAYGSGGLGNIVNTFLLLPQGVVISSANGPLHDKTHFLLLRTWLEQCPRHGIIWGTPYLFNKRWRVVVGTRSAAQGTIVGFTVELPLFFGKVSANRAMLWLDHKGAPLTSVPAWLPATLLPRIGSCTQQTEQSLQGIRVTCTPMATTSWHMLTLLREQHIAAIARTDLFDHMRESLAILLGLVLTLYFVLRQTLGKLLNSYIDIIGAQQLSLHDFGRLPEGRKDELGHIARAYNRLLEAVWHQYDALEAKVFARTQELDQARKLAEKASAHKSEQINNISHEIRTPLNGIVGALMLLGKTQLTYTQHHLVETALKCSGHLLEIINNVLDFSRLDAGQMLLSPTQVNTLEIIDQAMQTIQISAQDKGLSLQTLVAGDFPRQLHTDELRLRQILINLLGNAVKFTTQGGVQLRTYCQDDHACFQVIDTGPGISRDQQEDIFIPFRQLDSLHVGSGLGLSISRSLAQLLGGDLNLLPHAGGACFELQLPLKGADCALPTPQGPLCAPASLHAQLRCWGYLPQEGDNPLFDDTDLVFLPGRLAQRLADPDGDLQPAAPTLNPPWSLTILVVDDIDTNRLIIRQMLQALGQQVYEADSGAEALQLGEIHRFDLVLMDIQMPGMNGNKTLQHWRQGQASQQDADCPIIALTANAQPGERARLLAQGFNEYLTKPVTLTDLAQAVDFAADCQLLRGLTLEANHQTQTSVLTQDPHMQKRVQEQIRELHRQLQQAFRDQQSTESLRLLHTLKGIAGQAGLDLLRAACAEQERRIQAGEPWDEASWQALSRACFPDQAPSALSSRSEPEEPGTIQTKRWPPPG